IDFTRGCNVFRLDPSAPGKPPANASLDLLRDLRLQRQDVIQLAIESLAPDLHTVLRPHQAGADAYSVWRGSNASLDKIICRLAGGLGALSRNLLRSVR